MVAGKINHLEVMCHEGMKGTEGNKIKSGLQY